MRLAAGLALALVCLAPAALALDVLPTEIRFDALEARILVRSVAGSVRIETDPVVLAARADPGGVQDPFAPTPRVLAANATWHGLDGILVLVLARTDEDRPVDVIVEDGSRTGVLLEWPAVDARGIPLGAPAAIAALLAAALRKTHSSVGARMAA